MFLKKRKRYRRAYIDTHAHTLQQSVKRFLCRDNEPVINCLTQRDNVNINIVSLCTGGRGDTCILFIYNYYS